MEVLLYSEQALNGIQLGVMLFLAAAGLTLVFGIMNFINLAHGSLYMVGAFAAASALRMTGSFVAAVAIGTAAAALVGYLLERTAFRRLYARSHSDQVLATFGLLLFFNEAARILWGNAPLYVSAPAALSGFVTLLPGSAYPSYRLVVLLAGLAVGLGLFVLVTRTRTGMLIRAGAANREMLGALGIDVKRLFALVLALGAGLAGLAGVMMAPILSVQVGMGEPILILAFVVIVIGGLGSIRGAFAGALLVGLVDTFGRFLLPQLFGFTAGPALSSMAIYILMAAMLVFRPQGLFPVPAAADSQETHAANAPVVPRWIVLALCAAALALVPWLGEPFYTRLLTRIMIFALAALSLDLIFGLGGMVSFGHAAFLGLGAYTAGILAVHRIDDGLVVFPAAVAIAAIAAALIGLAALRTTGMFFIMITLAFGQMLFFLFTGLEAYGGDNGLPLRAPTELGGVRLNDPRALYYIALAALAAALFAAQRLSGSRFGTALRGIRDNEPRMRAIGFATFGYKLAAFTIAGALCGLAGALLVNVDSYVGPSTLHWFVSGELMVMVILGGAATLFGPVLGAAVYLLLKEGLSMVTEHWLVIFGPLLLLMVLFTRGGLYPWLMLKLRPTQGGTMKSLLGAALISLAASGALAADQIKIGFLSTNSGPGGVLGQDMTNGAQLALQHLGGKMGGVPAQILVEDDQQDAQVGVQKTQKLLEKDGANIIAGMIFGNVSQAVYGIVKPAGVFTVATIGAIPPILGPDCWENYFTVGSLIDDAYEALGDHLNQKGVKSVALMVPNYIGGKLVTGGFKRSFKGDVVAEIYTQVNQPDYAVEIAQVRAKRPDAVVVFYPGGMGINFLKQYKASGAMEQVPVYTSVYVTDESTFPALGDIPLGIIATSSWSPEFDNPANKKFVADFMQKHGKRPTTMAAMGYDTIALIGAAVNEVGGKIEDKDKFRAALRKANFQSVRGPFKFNNNHFPIQNYYLNQVAKDPNGKLYNKLLDVAMKDKEDVFHAQCPMKW